MPADYINKLARMFQDIKVSEDLNQEFKKNYKSKGDIAGTLLILLKAILVK
jgi:cullin-5